MDLFWLYCLQYRLKHENLVDMVGFSCDGQHPCLVYAFMANGSLLDRLACLVSTMYTKDSYLVFSPLFLCACRDISIVWFFCSFREAVLHCHGNRDAQLLKEQQEAWSICTATIMSIEMLKGTYSKVVPCYQCLKGLVWPFQKYGYSVSYCYMRRLTTLLFAR